MNIRNNVKLADSITMANNHREWLQRDGLDGVAPPVLTINHGPGSAEQTLADLRLFWGEKFFNEIVHDARQPPRATQIKVMALSAQFGVTGYAVELLLGEIAGIKTGNDVPGAKRNYYATRYNYGKVLQWLIGDENRLTEIAPPKKANKAKV